MTNNPSKQTTTEELQAQLELARGRENRAWEEVRKASLEAQAISDELYERLKRQIGGQE